MNAEVTLRSKGYADHLRLFWQTAESVLDLVPFEDDPVQTRYNILVAIQEAVSNVLRHGFGAGGAPDLELRLAWNGELFRIELRDSAPAFDPTQVWATPCTEDATSIPEGGYGILIMREVLDELRYRREGDQNILVMSKRVFSQQLAAQQGLPKNAAVSRDEA